MKTEILRTILSVRFQCVTDFNSTIDFKLEQSIDSWKEWLWEEPRLEKLWSWEYNSEPSTT